MTIAWICLKKSPEMLETFWDLRWLLKREMVEEFCDQGLTKLVTIDEAVSAGAVMRQKILNLCLQLLRALPNFTFGLKVSLTTLNWWCSKIKDMYGF